MQIVLSLLVLGFPARQTATGQEHREQGILPIYNFSPKEYSASAQNWAITQDERGVMYFGNNWGILEYDGVNWRQIKISNESNVRSLAIDRNGRVYAGGNGEFGCLHPDDRGRMQYCSLLPYVAEEHRNFGEVWNILASDTLVYFQTRERIFLWDQDTIRCYSADKNFHVSFMVNDTLYVREEGSGISYFDGDSFVPLPGSKNFADKSIFGFLALDPSTFLVATSGSGLYSFKPYGDQKNPRPVISRFRTGADDYLIEYSIFNAIETPDRNISIGTWGGGAVIIDRNGNVINLLDKTFGLQDQIIQAQFTDDHNNLWLALSNGISRVEIISPISHFGDETGLRGNIQSISRFNDQLFVATNAGLFRFAAADQEMPDKEKFKSVEGFDIECWSLINYQLNGQSLLLVITNDAVYQIDRDLNSSMILEGIPYSIMQSKLDPRRVYIGLENGVTSIYRTKGEWMPEGRIEDIDETIAHLTEDFIGNLWMGTYDQGVIKLNILSFVDNRIEETKITKFDSINGLPEGPFLMQHYLGRPLIATNKGLYKYIPHRNRFEPDTSFGIRFANGSHWIHRISKTVNEKTWMVTFSEGEEEQFEIGYLIPSVDNTFRWVTAPFTKISQSIIHAIYPEENGITWLGGPGGLFRYDHHHTKDYDIPFHTLLRSVRLGEDSLIFGGTYYDQNGFASMEQPDGLYYVLKHAYNSMTYEYAAQSGEDENFLKFRYFLEGYDKKWSDWSAESKKEYTNLPHGEYVFRVSSLNVFGKEGKEAQFKFEVLPPWYQTVWAYIGYVILLVGLIYFIVTIYTRHLRAIIRERTAEVVRQKEEIELKNQEITDSIQYASRIQSAVLPPGDYINQLLPERFILYLPRDIVSGDFYWLTSIDSKVITVAADCTGHGVPGAFMSMLGIAFLNEIVSKRDDIHAHEILNELRNHVIKSLHQTGKEGESKDGMDIALCIIDNKKMKLEFAGANNPLLLLRNGDIIQVKADKMPIGIHALTDQSFTLHELDIQKDDLLYTFSDGFPDQFGGPRNKKFMIKRFKELLLEIHHLDMEEQKKILKDTIYKWMEGTDQIDDIIVLGVKI